LAYCVSLMREQDVPQVTEIDREAFAGAVPPVNFQNELKNGLAHYVVAYDKTGFGDSGSGESEHYILGFAGFWLIAGEAHIVNIAVRQPYRRRGIGELLLISLIDLAVEMKAKLVTLEVRASNTAAQSLYYKYGFVLAGLRRRYYSDNKENAVIMTLEDIGSASPRERLNQLKQAYFKKWGQSAVSGCR
jgi:ribosomal-protein-alanine N-acetyltransferase